MRWVKLTLPPRERARWLLMTTRLSMSSLAGTARTLVAVGTVSEASMLFTTRDGAPRSGTTASSLAGPGAFTAAPLAEPFGEPLAAPLSVGAGVASGLLAVVWVLLAVAVAVAL